MKKRKKKRMDSDPSEAEDPFGNFGENANDTQGGRKSVTWDNVEDITGRQSSPSVKRKSLATAAYEQAMSNQNYLTKNSDEMAILSQDNTELQSFLQRRQSWKDGCGHSIAIFASRMREAMAAKKAANKFLQTALGRKLKLNNGPAKPQTLPGLGPSAILDYASKKREQLVGEAPPPAKRDVYSTFTCTKAIVPTTKRRAPKPNSPNAITDVPRANLSQTFAETETPPPKRLSPLKTHPPVAPNFPNKSAILPREHDRVTVVTGTVDYPKLLEDQRETFEVLKQKDQEYNELIETYDKIQYNIQRKFSMLLKVDNNAFLNLGLRSGTPA
eukprot:TRINITY_DN13296_c5_g1_i1.p1 TRINITY_DN13296_c5_g1~~TRINITY_DN13296_c5_g1_i1.p1  ORF type:complete len:329 (+),score=61.06 TRINITY_DN13296_c5_g1_i1:23-1009(+)